MIDDYVFIKQMQIYENGGKCYYIFIMKVCGLYCLFEKKVLVLFLWCINMKYFKDEF